MQFFVRIHQAGWSFAELERVWRTADDLGYDGASLYDLVGADGVECWTALSLLTARTQRLIAVPLVLANPYRHPALLAKMAATLDLASEGRLILGLGAGGSPRDAAAFGLPFPTTRRRVAALEEAVRLMRLLWRGGGSFPGTHYSLTYALGAPSPYRPGGPPVLIGGHGRRLVLPAIARQADIANVGFDLTPAEWRDVRSELAAHALRAGRDPAAIALSHNANVVIGRDKAEFAKRLRALARRRGVPVSELRKGLANALAGTPDTIHARLRDLEAAGVSSVFLLLSDLPSLASLRLFAETVMAPWRTAASAGLQPARRRPRRH